MMITISILILIVAIAIPSFNSQLSPILLTRVASIVLFYSGALAFNAFYIQSIGSGIGIYSGLFHVTTISQQLDIFLLIIAGLILIPRPGLIEYIKVITNSSSTKTTVKGSSGSNLENISDSSSIVHTEVLSGIGDKYSLIILFSTLRSSLLLSSSDLLSMYLSL